MAYASRGVYINIFYCYYYYYYYHRYYYYRAIRVPTKLVVSATYGYGCKILLIFRYRLIAANNGTTNIAKYSRHTGNSGVCILWRIAYVK